MGSLMEEGEQAQSASIRSNQYGMEDGIGGWATGDV